jgi:hypothetical protein
VTVDERLVVVKLVAGSVADGHIQLGDQIISVNGLAVATKDQFFYKVRFAFPRLRLVFKRAAKEGEAGEAKGPAPVPAAVPAAATQQPPSGTGIPVELEKFLRRRPGFEYLVAALDWPAQQERQLGIVLANRMHRVIVGGLKPGSLGEEKLKLLDRIVAVNTSPVSDKDIAKHLIVATGGKFLALVERPVSDAAKEEHTPRAQAPAAAAPAAKPSSDVGGDPSILPYDCLAISKTERDARVASPKAPLAAILRRSGGLRTSSKLSVGETSQTHMIMSDVNPNKRLRPTPRLFNDPQPNKQ